MVITFLTFGAMYLIMGALIRLYCLKFPDSPLTEAFAFAH